MDHITLSQWAELFVVAPCPADLLSRLALGLADDLVTTVALALAPEVPVTTTVHEYALEDAGRALDDLREGHFEGAAVVVP